MDTAQNVSAPDSITFLSGPLTGSTFPLNKPTITFGRETSNDIVIPDPAVSRVHAQLSNERGRWTLTKLAAQNTLTVNQRDAQQTVLQDQDTVSIGGTTVFRLQMHSGAQQAAASPAPGPAARQYPQYPQQQQQYPVSPAPQSYPSYGQPSTPSQTPQQAAFPNVQPSYAQQPPYIPTISAATPSPQGAEPGTMRAPTGFSPSGGDATGQVGVPTLEVTTNTDREQQEYKLDKSVINIGRDPSNQVIINRPTVSAFHAQIIREGNQLVFVHPHPNRGRTLNGITFQGQVIGGEQPFRRVLTRGDIFRISDEHGTLVTLTYNDGTGASQDAIPDIRPIPLGAPVLTIGRSSDNMVVLNHPQVSGHHARLEQVQGGYRVVDLRSTNHVFVNAQRVTNQMLKPGDEIRIGPFKLTYTGTQLTQHDESNGVRIDALGLVKTGNNNVVLINNISVAIPPRKFVALVGGSGAGKSTLMDCLNGLRPAHKGTVLYNGQDYYRNLASFSTQLGYVPQDDIIHRDITVEHALYYAAKLRLPDDYTEAQIKQRIEEVLEDVDMKKRRALLVSKLSGGQRKRVSIALELLANPNIFFLDEPTSGLDPGLDRKMMLLLRRLADRGRTIILVTHATNNINTCDYVCFLASGGHLAYFGPPDGAKAYFGKTDFAEIYSALEPTDDNPNIPAEAGARFQQSEDYKRFVVGPLNQGQSSWGNTSMQTSQVKPPKRGNPWKQFRILCARYLELLLNDRVNLWILILQAPVIGLILFFLTANATFSPTSIASCVDLQGKIVSCQSIREQLSTPQGQQFAASKGKTPDQLLNDSIRPTSGGDAQKILFIMAFAAVFFGCLNGSREIVKEEPIFKRERSVNLGITPYMFSKIIVLGLFSLVQSAIIVFLVNAKDPFKTSIFLPPVIEIYISMALTSLAGLMLGLTVSAMVPNSDRAVSIVPIVVIPQVIFSGVIFSLDNPVFLQFLAIFFPARWAMAAMGSSVGLHGDKLNTDGFSFKGTLFTTVNQNDSFAGAFFHLMLTWGALVATILVLGVAISWLLKRKDARS